MSESQFNNTLSQENWDKLREVALQSTPASIEAINIMINSATTASQNIDILKLKSELFTSAKNDPNPYTAMALANLANNALERSQWTNLANNIARGHAHANNIWTKEHIFKNAQRIQENKEEATNRPEKQGTYSQRINQIQDQNLQRSH